MIRVLGRQLLALGAALAACWVFALSFLDTEYYMLLFCGVAACLVYFLSKYLGREIYILVVFPKLFLANQLAKLFFNMSATNEDLLNPFKSHMFTVIILFVMALEFLELLYVGEIAWDPVLLCGLGVLMIFTGLTLWRRGGNGLGLLLESYFGPFLLFLLFYIKRDISLPRLRRIMVAMLAVTCALALFGLVEAFHQYNPYTEIFLQGTGYGGQSSGKYRVIGTVGHILFPMMMLTGCFLVHRLVKFPALRVMLYAFFFWAAMYSQTRIMLLLIACYIVGAEGWRVLKRDFSVRSLVKLAVILLAVGGVLFVALLQTSIGQRMMLRFVEDSGSGEARTIFIRYFFQNLFQMPLLGVGAFPEVVNLVDASGNTIIAEIPWIILYFEVGPFFLALLLCFLLLVIRSGDMPFELLVLLAAYTPYTSFTAKNQCFFLFFVLAVYAMARKRHRKALADNPDYKPPPPPRAFLDDLPRWRAGGVAAMALFLLLAATAGTVLGAGQVRQMPRMYRSHTELYLYPDVEMEEDLDYLDQNRGSSMWLYIYMNDDMVSVARTPRVEERMRALYQARTGRGLGRGDLSAYLQVENMFSSRILRISFADRDPVQAALVADLYAQALMEVMAETTGYQVLSVINRAVPAQAPYSPRPYAVTAVCGVWGAMVFLTAYLALDLARQLLRDYRQAPVPATG